MIGLRGVEVAAGDFSVGPLDLDVPAGEYAVLLGPSGAGKTLVLEALAGVRRVRAGRLLVDGADVTRGARGAAAGRPRLSGRAAVPASERGRTTSPTASIAQRRRGRAAAPSPRAEIASRSPPRRGVAHLLERRPATLSGGERQRVALARALAAAAAGPAPRRAAQRRRRRRSRGAAGPAAPGQRGRGPDGAARHARSWGGLRGRRPLRRAGRRPAAASGGSPRCAAPAGDRRGRALHGGAQRV